MIRVVTNCRLEVRVDLKSMVFEPGDRISGWGHLREHGDGVWFERRGAIALPFDGRPLPRAQWPTAIRLINADPAGVATEFGDDGSIPGWATVTGSWLGDSIRVESQSARATNPPSTDRRQYTTPPCARPPGGWPPSPGDGRLEFDLKDLKATGAAVSWVQFSPGPDQAVLVVAATDAAMVESVLRPQLGPALCVVASRWSRPQLDAVRDYLRSHWQQWGIQHISGPIDERGQRSVSVHLIRVFPGLAQWATELPDGLLQVMPALLPAPPVDGSGLLGGS